MPKNLLIIGCGANGHAVHFHGWNEITVHHDITTHPTYCGSITNPHFILSLKSHFTRYFDCVYFENIPYRVLSDDLDRLMVMNAVDQLLKPRGVVRIRTGADGAAMIRKLTMLLTRWGYVRIFQGRRPRMNLANRLDLPLTYGREQGFDVGFGRLGYSRRTGATV